jgi:NAD(P)H-dependent flavin oxidoreductase YrpB (nitropropane dioxygenase family)
MIPIRDAAAQAEEADYMNLACGEGISLIDDIPTTAELVERLTAETVTALASAAEHITWSR